jgi:hypothetical protein
MDTQPTAGWYDDGTGTVRWWDGAAWTGHVATAPSASTPHAPSSAAATYQAVQVETPIQGDPRFGSPAGGTASATVQGPDRGPDAFGHSGTTLPGRRALPAEPSGLHRQLPPRVEGFALLLLGSLFAGPVLLGLFFALAGRSGGSFSIVAIVFGVLGAIVAGNGIAALLTGNRAPAMSWVSMGDRDAARGDRRLLIMLGVVLALVAASFLFLRNGPSSADEAASPSPAATAPASPKAKLPQGYAAVGTAGGYKLLAPSATACAKGTSCRAVSLASRTTCKALTALVVFANASGERIGSDVVVVKKTKPGTPVKARAAIAEPGGTSVRVSSLVCASL